MNSGGRNQGSYGNYGYEGYGGSNKGGYDYSNYYQDGGSGYGYGSSGGGAGPGSSFGGNQSGGGFDKLQEQLAIRESQLAMASNLLEQQSRLITEVSTTVDRGGRDDRKFGGFDDRKRRMSDYGRDNKRRRTDSRSYEDDRRDGRRGFDSGGRWGGRRSPQRFGGGGRDRGGRDRGRDRRQGGRGPPGQGRRDGGRPAARGVRGGKGRGDSKGEQQQKGGPKKPKIVPWVSKELSRTYCHVCEVECFNERNFQNHQAGSRHKEKLSELEENPTRKAEVEERVKKQEEERAKPEPEKIAVDHCDICDIDIHVPLENHLKFKQHRHRETQVKRGCSWCNVGGFANFTEVLAHRASEEHQEYREQFGGRYRPDVIPKPEYMEAEEIPERAEGTPYGKDYVVPVTGFFCKLCNKFYKKEAAAKEAHCLSEGHYDKWKQAKIDAIEDYKKKIVEQREREEAAAKRIEELAEKKKEALAALQGLNGENPDKMETDGEAAADTGAQSAMETEEQTGGEGGASLVQYEADESEQEAKGGEWVGDAEGGQEASQEPSQDPSEEAASQEAEPEPEEEAPTGRTRRTSKGRAKGRKK